MTGPHAVASLQAHGADPAAIAKQALAYSASFTSPIHSLEHAREEVQYPSSLEGHALGRMLLTVMGAYGRKQQLYNGAAVLYAAITEQAEEEALQRGAGR